MTDRNATDQGITQQTGPDIEKPERRARQLRIGGLRLMMGSYTSRVPGRITVDITAVSALLDEISDLNAERDAAQHGWDDAAEQFRALQDETSAEVRRLRAELDQATHRYRDGDINDLSGQVQRLRHEVAAGRARIGTLDAELDTSRRHNAELDHTLAQRLQELLELRRETTQLRQESDQLRGELDRALAYGDQRSGQQQAQQPSWFPPLVHQMQPPPVHQQQAPPPVQTHTEFRARLTGQTPTTGAQLPPELRQHIDEHTGGRPWELDRVEHVGPGEHIVHVSERIGCQDPEALDVAGLAERWDTTENLVRAFLNAIQWPHQCEDHGHRVLQHEAAELRIKFVTWRQAQTGATPMTPPWGTDGEVLSAAEVLVRGERLQLQLVEINGHSVAEYHPVQLLMAGIQPAATQPAGLGWDPANGACVESMHSFAQIGAKFRRVG